MSQRNSREAKAKRRTERNKDLSWLEEVNAEQPVVQDRKTRFLNRKERRDRMKNKKTG